MEEIRVGDYIRTPSGDIGMVTNTELIGPEIFTGTKYLVLAPEGIKKHSSNVLDLIEIGDVLKLQEKDGDIGYLGWEKDTTTLSYKEMLEEIKNKEVKLLGIVTHEQFESIKYRLE